MAGYSPARNNYLDCSRESNWLKRWWKKRRDRKAEHTRAWIKFLSGMCMEAEERKQFWAYLDSRTTEEILAKPNSYPHYVDFSSQTEHE